MSRLFNLWQDSKVYRLYPFLYVIPRRTDCNGDKIFFVHYPYAANPYSPTRSYCHRELMMINPFSSPASRDKAGV